MATGFLESKAVAASLFLKPRPGTGLAIVKIIYTVCYWSKHSQTSRGSRGRGNRPQLSTVEALNFQPSLVCPECQDQAIWETQRFPPPAKIPVPRWVVCSLQIHWLLKDEVVTTHVVHNFSNFSNLMVTIIKILSSFITPLICTCVFYDQRFELQEAWTMLFMTHTQDLRSI